MKNKLGGKDNVMSLEKNIAEHIREKGISVTVMARCTGISFRALYDSLMNKNKCRRIRGDELLAVCAFLEKDPRDFIDNENE